MAFATLLAALAATTGLVQGHYTFARLRVNDGDWLGPLQYIRNKTDMYRELPMTNSNTWERTWNSPTYYLDPAESVRCGRDSMSYAADTESLTVKAGDTVQMAIVGGGPSDWTDANWDCPNDWGTCWEYGYYKIIHDGPVVVHLSKVPDGQKVTEYDGSGDWTKIYTMGFEWREDEYPDAPLFWLPKNKEGLPPNFTFKIPEQTPPGEYLMRMDQIWPAVSGGCGFEPAQLYPSCAHLKIESESTAKMPASIKIPDGLIHLATGMSYSREMSDGKTVDENWWYPGGYIWDGENLKPDAPAI